MHSLASDLVSPTPILVVSAKANLRDAQVKESAAALSGRSQNDFICAAKIDALLDA